MEQRRGQSVLGLGLGAILALMTLGYLEREKIAQITSHFGHNAVLVSQSLWNNGVSLTKNLGHLGPKPPKTAFEAAMNQVAAADEDGYEKAQENLYGILAHSDDASANYLVEQAVSAQDQGDYASARQLFLEALSFVPRQADILVRLASIDAEYGPKMSAEMGAGEAGFTPAQTLRQALRYQPNHPAAWASLAQLEEENGALDAARSAWWRAYLLDPHLPGAASALARLDARKNGVAM